MPEQTSRLGLDLPDFDQITWHDEVNNNFEVLDAAVGAMMGMTGIWRNSTLYEVGDRAVDPDNATIYVALVEHTSSATGSFSTYRALNPTHWGDALPGLAEQYPHFTDNANAPAGIPVGVTIHRAWGYYEIDQAYAGLASEHTYAFFTRLNVKAGQIGPPVAGQFMNYFGEVPGAMTGGSPAVRGWVIHPQGVNLSGLPGLVMEGAAGIVSSSGQFSGLMGGVWGVCEANLDSTPSQKHRFIALDHGALTDTVQASTAFDAMYTATSAGGVGPKAVFQVSNAFGAMPAKADGSTEVFNFAGSATWSIGFDLTGQIFTNGAILLPNASAIRALSTTIAPIYDLIQVNAANQVQVGDSDTTLVLAAGDIYCSNLLPILDDDVIPGLFNLGSAANQWKDLYLGLGSEINFDNGDVRLIHAADMLSLQGGKLIIGGTLDQVYPQRTGVDNTPSPMFQIEGLDGSVNFGQVRFSNSANGPRTFFAKSRGATLGVYTVVQTGDELGEIIFAGSDGTDLDTGASIRAEVDTTPGANDIPGRLILSTSADGAAGVTDRWIVDSLGHLKPATGTSGAIIVRTVTFAQLPAAPIVGMMFRVSDSNTAVWGATIAGGGANSVLAWYNGTNWKVAGI